MSLLLDTHALLRWLSDEPLSVDAAERIRDPQTLVVVSAASIWEAAIKAAMGKLDVPGSLSIAVIDNGFEPLPIALDHAERAAQLPQHHRDPFDRMLVAQAQHERLSIVTRDSVFAAYDVEVVLC